MQYTFIYQALLEYYLYGDTELDVSSLEKHLQTLHGAATHFDKVGLEEEFRVSAGRLPRKTGATHTRALSIASPLGGPQKEQGADLPVTFPGRKRGGFQSLAATRGGGHVVPSFISPREVSGDRDRCFLGAGALESSAVELPLPSLHDGVLPGCRN